MRNVVNKGKKVTSMKRLFYILIFVFINSCLLGQKLKIKHEIEYYDFNKSVISKDYSYYVENQRKIYQGEFKTYYRNGQIEQIMNYKKGLVNGKSLRFYETGQKLSESEYLDGIQVGEINKYFDNGKLMYNAITENNSLVIKKYGFPDGSYAIRESESDSTCHFNIFDSGGTLLCKAENGFNENKDSFKSNCKLIWHYKYPEILVEFEQEGLVVFNLSIDKNGKLINAKPIIGFHEEAIKETLNSIKKNNCFPVKHRNGESFEYDINIAFVYKMN